MAANFADVNPSMWPVIWSVVAVLAALLGGYVSISSFMNKHFKDPITSLKNDLKGTTASVDRFKDSLVEQKELNAQFSTSLQDYMMQYTQLRLQFDELAKDVASIGARNSKSHQRIYERMERIEMTVSKLQQNITVLLTQHNAIHNKPEKREKHNEF